MKGELAEERLYLKPESWYEDNQIDLVLGQTATHLDPVSKEITLSDSSTFTYSDLIIATGSRPRPLRSPGADLDGVFDLRSISDVESIRPNLEPGKRLVIIGAGYIGLEAAAVARQLGLEVTVLEMADRVLARVTSPVISAFYEDAHEAEGVNILTSTRLSSLQGADGRIESVVLENGEEIAADIVLVGIGILPNTELADAAGLECHNGIRVDPDARTSAPNVYAIGDCTLRPLVHYKREGRLESVHNAIEQGKLAAAAITGKDRPPEDCPWFWSDQYKLKLQIAGLSTGFDTHVVRGDLSSGRFSVFYFKGGSLIAADAVNSPPDFIVAKKLICAGVSPDPADLEDSSKSIKDIANALL